MHRPPRFLLLLPAALLALLLRGQGTTLVSIGGALTDGAILSQADYPAVDERVNYGLNSETNSPAQGYGMQIGYEYVHGQDSLVARFGLGFRIHYRNYRQYTVTGGYSMSPSSFVSNEFTYDGLITSKELKFGMPMSVWFRISPRSRVYACLEFQVAIARGFFEEGTATTTTTHYGLPDYQPVSVTVKDEPYERHIPIKTSVGSRFAGSLGYRFRFNDRFMVGPDAALVVDPLWSEAGDTLVRELSFSFVWTFNTPDGTSTR